jgi:hypothetical protein
MESSSTGSQTGAIAVDMESTALERKAAEWNIPYLCIRAVSDRVGDTLPLGFNRYRNARGLRGIRKYPPSSCPMEHAIYGTRIANG